MHGKTLLVSFFFIAILTGCANTSTETLRMRADARAEGLRGVSISRGACDGVGQFIPLQNMRNDEVSLEASAAPTH